MATHAYFMDVHRSITIPAASGEVLIATLDKLPSGQYVFFAKAVVGSPFETSSKVVSAVQCRLAVGDHEDSVLNGLSPTSGEGGSSEAVALTLGASIEQDGGMVQFFCGTGGTEPVIVNSVKITALQVDTLTIRDG
jgi:hypothetical protein